MLAELGFELTTPWLKARVATNWATGRKGTIVVLTFYDDNCDDDPDDDIDADNVFNNKQ